MRVIGMGVPQLDGGGAVRGGAPGLQPASTVICAREGN